MPSQTTVLDHIIILVPYKDVLQPPEWLTRNFSITPGGVHADGKTANKLITFQDGSYLELIAFVNDDPKNKAGHYWGSKRPGIIDFAFTSTEGATTHYEALRRRLSATNASISYAPPKAGGRKREDGEVLKWEITSAENESIKRGVVPFFCHDVTPRALRVPRDAENITHPSKVYGVKSLTIVLPKDQWTQLSKDYPAILDADSDGPAQSGTAGKKAAFPVHNLYPVDGTPESTVYVRYPAEEEDELEKLVEEQGVVLTDLVLGGFESQSRQQQQDVQESWGGIFLG